MHVPNLTYISKQTILKTPRKPVFGKISESGAATFVNNQWINCSRLPKKVLSAGGVTGEPLSDKEEVLAGTFNPSCYYSYRADTVADVPSLVSSYAGVGKMCTDE